MSDNIAAGRQLLAGALQVSTESIPDTASIGTFEAWDSLAHVRVMTAIEEAIARKLTTEEIVKIAGLADIVALLNRPRD